MKNKALLLGAAMAMMGRDVPHGMDFSGFNYQRQFRKVRREKVRHKAGAKAVKAKRRITNKSRSKNR